MRGKKILAIFDFDKTLIKQDSFILFSLTASARFIERLAVIRDALLCKFGVLSNEEYKKRVLLKVWNRKRKREQEEILKILYCRLAAAEQHAVVDRLKEHVRVGDRVVVMSASPAFYVSEYVRSWSREVIVCASVLSAEGQDMHYQNLDGLRKAEIAQSLMEQQRPENVLVYTDHINDLPLIQIADFVFLVNPSRKLEREVIEKGISFDTIRT